MNVNIITFPDTTQNIKPTLRPTLVIGIFLFCFCGSGEIQQAWSLSLSFTTKEINLSNQPSKQKIEISPLLTHLLNVKTSLQRGEGFYVFDALST